MYSTPSKASGSSGLSPPARLSAGFSARASPRRWQNRYRPFISCSPPRCCWNSRFSACAGCRVCPTPCSQQADGGRWMKRRSAARCLPVWRHAFNSPFLINVRFTYFSVRDHVDVSVFSAGRNRQAKLRRPRRAHGFLRQCRFVGEYSHPRRAAVLDRARVALDRRCVDAGVIAAGEYRGLQRAGADADRSPSWSPIK